MTHSIDYTGVARPMTKEDKDKWLTALRSGKYMQGRCVLYDQENETYCCLGVANKVLSLNVPSNELLRYGSPHTYQLLPHYAQQALAGMNDTDGNTFTQVADHIERTIKAVDE